MPFFDLSNYEIQVVLAPDFTVFRSYQTVLSTSETSSKIKTSTTIEHDTIKINNQTSS